METVKILDNGQSQTVTLTGDFRLSGDEVFIRKLGNMLLLTPKEKAWETFLEGLNSFTDDFFQEGRD